MDAAQSKRTRNCKDNPKANHRGAQKSAEEHLFCHRFALMSADFNPDSEVQCLRFNESPIFVK
jgi:hypothetical protein